MSIFKKKTIQDLNEELTKEKTKLQRDTTKDKLVKELATIKAKRKEMKWSAFKNFDAKMDAEFKGIKWRPPKWN